MTETPHIFDEFYGAETSLDLLHRKRVALEPLVFGILKQKYGAQFREAWASYRRPANSDRCVLIIERRIHENLEFLLHNVAYYCAGWNIAFICSDVNHQYINAILGQKRTQVLVKPMFSGSPDRDTARADYNTLLKSAEFYESLPWKHLFIVQTDSYLRAPIPEALLEYDFCAAPTAWDPDAMAGGMSYRRRDAMIDICKQFQKPISGEDCFIHDGAKHLGYKVPTHDVAQNFIVESCMTTGGFGTHQWWTYWSADGPGSEDVFHALLTCEPVLDS